MGEDDADDVFWDHLLWELSELSCRLMPVFVVQFVD